MSSHEHDRDLRARSGLRVKENAFDLREVRGSAKSARDSLGQPKVEKHTYITAKRLRTVVNQLTSTDLQIIEILDTVRLASGRQLQLLLFGEGTSDARMARRRLQALTDAGVLARLERRPSGVRGGSLGYVYALNILGQAIVGVPPRRRRPRLPSMAYVAHALAVTDCYITLRRLEADKRLELVAFEIEPTCWREFSGPAGALQLLKPDAFVVTASDEWEDHWLLEVDRATESRARLKRKCLTHIAYCQSGRGSADTGIVPKVLWVVPNVARCHVLYAVIAELELKHRHLFEACTEANFAEVIVAGAGSENLSEVDP